MYTRRNERVESCLLIRLLLFLYAERKAYGNQSETVRSYFYTKKLRKSEVYENGTGKLYQSNFHGGIRLYIGSPGCSGGAGNIIGHM